MYFWKVDSLVDDFKSDKVTQHEEFKYMMLFTITMLLATDPYLYVGASYNHYDTLGTIVMLCISILGIYYCYKINKSGDDRDFIVRVMCLGLPVMVRALVIFMPIFIILGVLEIMIFEPEAMDMDVYENTPVQVAVLAAFVFSYYWYLSIKIRAVSS